MLTTVTNLLEQCCDLRPQVLRFEDVFIPRVAAPGAGPAPGRDGLPVHVGLFSIPNLDLGAPIEKTGKGRLLAGIELVEMTPKPT